MRRLRATFGMLWIAVLALTIGHDCFSATSFSSGVQTGSIQNTSVTEASGIAASRTNANVLWTHNDSGNAAQVFPMTAAGTNLGTYTISGATNTDWEDIAIGPGPASGAEYLYIGDIGDNNGNRSNVSVYRVPEPAVSDTQSPVTTSLTGAAKFTFVYPDGPRDAESMFVDPLTKDIYIITKRENPKHLYRAAYPQSTSGTTTLQLMTTFNDGDWLTAADISPDGNEIIVRSYLPTSGRMYTRPTGGSITDALNSTPVSIPLRLELQGEAIGFDRAGSGYYTTSEGSHPAIYYFDRLPHGDFNHDGTVDAADYVVWKKGFGTTYTLDDYNIWRANFGTTNSADASGSSMAVPEPAQWFILWFGSMAGITSRRHLCLERNENRTKRSEGNTNQH